MWVMVLFRVFSDLTFYYTFAGSFAALFGAGHGAMFCCAALAAGCFGVSYRLREKGNMKMLPFLALPLALLIPDLGLAGMAALLPVGGYVVYLAWQDNYEPEYMRQVELFSLYWKLFFVAAGAGLLYGRSGLLSGFTLPCGVLTGVVSVLLMRSLRHDREVYEDRSYQMLNLAMVAGVSLFAMLLSSKVFLDLCGRGAMGVYNGVMVPVLRVVLVVIGTMVYGVIWAAAKLLVPQRDVSEILQLDMGQSFDEIFETQEAVESGAFLGDILIFVGVVIAVILAVVLLKRLAGSKTTLRSTGGMGEVRTHAQPRVREMLKNDDPPAVQRVRRQYQKFLRLCQEKGVPFTQSSTSAEIQAACKGKLEPPAAGELRELYIRARYDADAGKEEAQRAKELWGVLKKS